MKSVQKKLLEAAELATSVGITNNDIESVSIYDSGTTFRLKPVALSRVFRQQRIPRSKLIISEGTIKELYVCFTYRGVRWSTYISRDVMQEFKATIDAVAVNRIEGPTKQPRLNACRQRCQAED
jgi:hypothetical protein